jgi:hypothetical protein
VRLCGDLVVEQASLLDGLARDALAFKQDGLADLPPDLPPSDDPCRHAARQDAGFAMKSDGG